MELLQLKYFQVVARNQHITRSAEQLNVSQPTISMMIARLEKELGVPLFNRVGRHMELNEYGRAFLARVNHILDETESAKIELNKMRVKNDSTISLALSSPLLVKGIAVSFLAMYPNLKWQQSVSPLDEIVRMLQNDAIDFCITLPPVYCDNMETIILLENDYVIAAHPDHPIAKQRTVSLKQIAQENIISLHEGFSFRKQVDELLLSNNLSYNNVIECDHTLRKELINANQGITITVQSAYMRNLFDPHIKMIPIAENTPKQRIAMTVPKNKKLTTAARKLQKYIIDYYSEIDVAIKSVDGNDALNRQTGIRGV